MDELPEVSYDRYKKYRLEQRANDVLWGVLVGVVLTGLSMLGNWAVELLML